MASQPPLIRALQDPGRYPHPVSAVTLLETHISWVLLTGDWAYKIKKPVNFGFVDFSTPERRRFFCHEELRLNRRLAPRIYRDVVAIGGTPEAPVLGGGEPFEYAVRMREFRQDARLDLRLQRGEVQPAHIDRIAEILARFHAAIERADPRSPYADPERIHRPVRENFAQIEPLLADPAARARLAALREWSEREYAARRGDLAARAAGGYIRECHGDLHLGNIAWVDGAPAIFDCLEFNPQLRWIDVVSEYAFLDMDLEDRGRADLARRFVDAYLQQTGDYAGLALHRYYRVYRAVVRAKVTALRSSQEGTDAAARAAALETCRGYLEFAARAAAPTRPFLLLTHGPSGSGKTTVTQTLLERLGAVRLRSDVERKRLHRLAPLETSGSPPGGGIYTAAADDALYARLEGLAADVLGAGHAVIVDATFLRRGRRLPFYALARRLAVPVLVLEFAAPASVLRARIGGRTHDASEADLQVLQRQLERIEPPDRSERGAVAVIGAGPGDDAEGLARRIRMHLDARRPDPDAQSSAAVNSPER